MTQFVGLVRGINVGGKQLPMSTLRSVCESLGYRDVRTHLQSGNVVFRAARASGDAIAEAIRSETGMDVTVILRTAEELRAVVDANPIAEFESNRLVVVFLDHAPSGTLAYSGPEPYHLLGRELYVNYVDGQGRSKLTNSLIERKLGVRGTARNWNTVTALLALV